MAAAVPIKAATTIVINFFMFVTLLVGFVFGVRNYKIIGINKRLRQNFVVTT